MFPIITSLTYLPFAWTANNFIFLRNYKKRIIKYTETDVRKCIHYIVWFPTKLLIVMKTKFSYSLQNKPHYRISVKSCACASFFLSFFFFPFSGLIQIIRLINLQLFSVGRNRKKKNTSSAQKAVCVKNGFFFHTSFTYFRMAEFLSVLLAPLIAFRSIFTSRLWLRKEQRISANDKTLLGSLSYQDSYGRNNVVCEVPLCY